MDIAFGGGHGAFLCCASVVVLGSHNLWSIFVRGCEVGFGGPPPPVQVPCGEHTGAARARECGTRSELRSQ